MARLAKIDNIAGIKEASGGVQRVRQIHELCGQDFIVLSGEDAVNYELMEAGAAGVISVTANVDPARIAQMCTAAEAGDYQRARDIHERLRPLHEVLFSEPSPAPAKWALHAMGHIGSGIRLPLLPLSEAGQEKVRAVMQQLDLPCAESAYQAPVQ